MIDRSLQKLTTKESFVIRTFGVLLIIAGFIHWLIIFGILSERSPFILTVYFNSLSIIDILAGIGMLLLRPWGLKIVFFIIVTQIPAHLYMMYLDTFQEYQSGFSVPGRVFDMALLLIGLFYTRKFFQLKR